MEFLLNSVWFAVCLLLVSWWLRDARSRAKPVEWRTGVALALLIVLLFPVISMTDDLLMTSSPAEAEHMLQRAKASVDHATMLAPVALFGTLAVVLGGLVVRWRPLARNAVPAGALRDVFVAACGVRPPPAGTLALA